MSCSPLMCKDLLVMRRGYVSHRRRNRSGARAGVIALLAFVLGVLCPFAPASALTVDNRLLSVGQPGDTGNGWSAPRGLGGADGRYVLFGSMGGNFVDGVVDQNGSPDVFLHDRVRGVTSLVSRSIRGTTVTANHHSQPIAISADGEWVLFESFATDLVPGIVDVNGSQDVFLYRRSTGAVTVVSRAVASSLTTGNGASSATAISDDGEWVLFSSEASNLVSGVTDGDATQDVFVFQRSTGFVTLVSRSAASPWVAANGGSTATAISSDGEWIVFSSTANDLAGGAEDGNAQSDVFMYRRSTGMVQLVSRAAGDRVVTPNGWSVPFAISADGEWVLYSSTATNIVAGVTDANLIDDVFLFRRSTGSTQLVSRAHGATLATPSGVSRPLSISDDGEWVLFLSFGNNVDAGIVDNNGSTDLFLFRSSTGAISLVSRSMSSPSTTANGWSGSAVSSADGEWVLFASEASNLVAGVTDDNWQFDMFLFQRSTGIITLASRAANSPMTTANGPSSSPTALSADGRWALFSSSATDLVTGVADGNREVQDVFMSERDSQAVRLVSASVDRSQVSANGQSFARAISANGASVLLSSAATNILTAGPVGYRPGSLLLHRPDTDETTIVSRSAVTPGAAANSPAIPAMLANGALSADGEWVLFWSKATDLVTGVADADYTRDVFLFRVSTGSTTLVSRSATGMATANGESIASAISSDGEWLLFESEATNLVAGTTDTNAARDVFLQERRTGQTTLVSRAANMPGATANGGSFAAGISADGEWVLFISLASNVVVGAADDNATTDVFLFQRSTGTVSLVSRTPMSATTTGNDRSVPVAISACGGRILFESLATNLVTGVVDDNLGLDVFLFRRDIGTVELVSRSQTAASRTANRPSRAQTISADGNWVLISSGATDLVSGVADVNLALTDVFLYDVGTESMTLVSRAEASTLATANGLSSPAGISDDGEWVLLQSTATDLLSSVAYVPWGANNLFLYRRSTGAMTLVTRSGASAAVAANSSSESVAMSAGGEWVVFNTYATDLVNGVLDGNWSTDVYLARVRADELFTDGFEALGAPLAAAGSGTAAPGPSP